MPPARSGSGESPSVKGMDKESVLALQQDFLHELSSPSFQKKLRQATSLQTAGRQESRLSLVRQLQKTIIPKHGFPASDLGVQEMLLAIQALADDADVYVNNEIIQEHLSSCESPPPGKDDTPVPLGHDKQSLSKRDIFRLLKSLHVSFGEPSFQKELAKLVKAQRDFDKGDNLNVPGRNELAYAVQVQLAPCFGFEASKAGVLEMITACGKFLNDSEVSHLFDAVNAKLGMSPSACDIFRRRVQQ